MSQRVKKPGRSADDSQGKRRRRRPSGSDADEDGTRSGSNSGGNGSLTGMWTPRHLNDLKVSSIYNRNSAEAPAELYRKDLISAMKLPDGEPLTPEEYWLITDSWKQEWEKGVQVPVNPESLPEPEVKLIQPVADRSHDFRLPKKKYVRVTHDDFFNPDYHQLVSTAARAEKVCSYDLDDVDAAWLGCSNADRAMQNTTLISEFLMEQVIEELELQCWEQVQTILKSQEGLGIEYDENVICDVCRSPESEEGNEMVFCDSCNICVHQACYGITTIPSGSWLCRTCTLGIKPTCVLCPNVGGAMKATRSGHTWAHVACAIWIPEVSIGSVEKMEPITKISSIPQSRWSLVCVLCKEKTGACIQCSVKTCKTAYHVTCAFKNGLEMKPIIVDENAEDGIKLRSYCQKHSVNTKNKEKAQSGSEDDAEKKKLKAMTAEERNQARAEKLQQIEAEFYKYVRLKDVSQNLAVDMDIVILIYNYWKLKRKSLNNRPLVPPRPETTQLLTQQQEQDLEQMKMFVQLRQDLERVRNLCYMVSRREKLSRSFFRLREQTFQKQLTLLTEDNNLSPEEREAILNANHGPSIYDQFYSHSATSTSASSSSAAAGSSANKSVSPDYETIISLIAGLDAKKDLVNGVIKTSKRHPKHSTGLATSSAEAVNSALNSNNTNSSSTNASGTVTSVLNSSGEKPYRKQFVNGARHRNLLGTGSSHSESESEKDKLKSDTAGVKKKKGAATTAAPGKVAPAKGNRKPLSYLFDSDSSVENATPGASTAASKKGKQAKGKAKGKALTKTGKGVMSTSYLSDSDELELAMVRGSSKGRTSAIGTKDNVPIYSDSDETGEEKSVATVQTSNKKEAKAKGAVAAKQPTKKSKAAAQQSLTDNQNKQSSESPVTKKRSAKDKGASSTATATTPPKTKRAGGKKGKKGDFDPTELIVPQREAAKKATESIRSVKPKAKDQQNQEGNADGSLSGSKEDISKEGKSKKVSTLSDSEGEEKGTKQLRRGRSPERKLVAMGKLSKKGARPSSDTELNDDETGDMDRDEFDFDDKEDGPSKNVNYVPQRQAAKKAAEHIRSGLSNIVAARLIIEDEMEMARKKTKSGKGLREENDDESQLEGDSLKLESGVADAVKKGTSKERVPSKGPVKSGKAGKKDSLEQSGLVSGTKAGSAAAGKEARGLRDTADWPFLDKGSQSACRRSRERSSSSSSGSSGSSSSGSSCSSRSSSASSSRSSSAESASPEPRSPVVTKKASHPSQLIATVGSKLPVTSKDTGPGRKLKTSERRPNVRAKLRAETSPREKPAAKGGRPTKSGPGRGDPFRSAFSPSPEPETKPSSPNTQQREQLEKRPLAPHHNKVTPLSKAHEQQQQRERHRLGKSKGGPSPSKGLAAETKGGRRKGESSSAKLTQAEKDSESEATAGEKRSSSKALTRKSPVKHTGPCLSSESETEVTTKPEHSAQSRSNSRSQLPAESSHSPTRKRKNNYEGGSLGLSDSESGAEEKENSCVAGASELQQRESDPLHPSASSLPSRSQKTSSQKNLAASGPASILSPLTPTENKEKEQSHGRATESEQPESKRPRLDSATVPSTSGHLKSIFSPPGSTGAGREGEILDFDSELYDLARSVVTDEYPHGEDMNSGGSLSFSFSQELFSREDNKEDSARATLNLVEKLRLQHARKSGVHRPSTESSSDVPCDSLLDDERPDSSLQEEKKLDEMERNDSKSTPQTSFDRQSSKSPKLLHSSDSPDRTKQSIQGDERWVPPSSQGHLSRHAAAQEGSALTPRGAFANIPEQSPPVPKRAAKSQHSAGDEGEQHMLRSPSYHHDMTSTHARPRTSHSSGSTEGSDKNSLSVDIHSPAVSSSPIISPVIPGLSAFPPGSAAAAAAAAVAASVAAAETSPNLAAAAAAAGLPFGANPFMYPALANNPAFASVVSSLAPFLQVPLPKTSPAVLGPVSPLNFPGPPANFQQFMPPSSVLQAQNQSGGQGQSGQQVRTPTPSPTSKQQQRRQSDGLPLVSVSASMPLLAKPPLTSPSVLLQLGGVKSVTPPVMSNMAHIIESVVNNHRSDTHLPKTTLSLDMQMPSTTASAVTPSSTNTTVKTPLTSPVVTAAALRQLAATGEGISAVLSNKTTENIITGREKSSAPAEEANVAPPTVNSNVSIPKRQEPPASGGRGRRASAQRTPVKAPEKLSGVNAVIEDMMISPQPKAKPGRKPGSQTPRAKAPAGRGRGKGRGKKVVGVRKDLAGTVYDIDFDEFEENSEEKIDLRALRERRKSSDVHSSKEEKHSKHSEHSGPILLTLSVPHSEKHSRHRSNREEKEHKSSREKKEKEAQQQPQPTVPPISIKVDANTKTLTSSTSNGSGKGTPNEKIHSILQAPLPGPVDMRTYSATSESGEEGFGKMGFPPAKDPSSEIASLFMSGSGGGGAGTSTTVNDLEELDKALEVLVSTPKPGAGSTPKSTEPHGISQVHIGQRTPAQESAVKDVIANDSSQMKLLNNTQQPQPIVNNVLPTMGVSFEQIASKQLDIMNRESLQRPVAPPSTESDMSRNQLKVKIKGPFLDANYSSANSMPHGVVPGSSHQFHSGAGSSMMPSHLSTVSSIVYPTSQNSYGQEQGQYNLHHQQQQWMMGNNTSNLRRMRKKELLRQYWTQDMNMDGGNSSFPPGAGGSGMSEMSAMPPNQGLPNHPISRSVITIPKAVASMSIIPTKEDYRLEEESNDSNPGSQMGDLWPASGSGPSGSKGKTDGTQKKRRSRGIYREMAALGILPPDAAPKERRRDRGSGSGNGGNTPENSRKRARNNNKPSRSTFIPPTLAESVDSNAEKSGQAESGNNQSNSSAVSAALVNLVNHPTPKLKIKFGDLSNATGSGNNTQSAGSSGQNTTSALSSYTNHLSDSDKETPNKKAKGRPPKKRGLPDPASAVVLTTTSSSGGFSMEALKRESMKYRELIMKDYAKAEQQEILKLSGTRRSKKHKRKAGASAAGSETDDGSTRSKSPEVKVITDGPKPKLILRFGKNRGGPGNTGSDNSNSSSIGMSSGKSGKSKSASGKVSENGLPAVIKDENSQGSNSNQDGSEGASLMLANEEIKTENTNKPEVQNNNNNGGGGDNVVVLELKNKTDNLLGFAPSPSQQQTEPAIKGENSIASESSSTSSTASASTVPIKLKLSRCYEGMKVMKVTGKDRLDVVERENGGAPNNAAKQSDSCQVR